MPEYIATIRFLDYRVLPVDFSLVSCPPFTLHSDLCCYIVVLSYEFLMALVDKHVRRLNL